MGKCNQCGECCKYINLGRVISMTPEHKDYVLARGAVQDQGFFLLPFVCPHLIGDIRTVMNGKTISETWKCDIHATKPKICQEFDGKRYKNHKIYWVPKECTMVKDA